ncbi:MAG: glycosyltransferase [Nitrospirae bacterium]|nr:glycosyltransferase [Nitrospirota bacterium]
MAEKPLGIIIPVYNEAENIGETLKKIQESVATPHTVYLVYDFPEDTTVAAAVPFGKRGMDIVFLENRRGGVANAIRQGLSSAPNNILLVTMADVSDDLSVVDEMYSLMASGYDVICGSRYAPGGKQIGGPFFKKQLSRAAGLSLFWLGAVPIRDVTNSFKMYRKSILENMLITSDRGFEIGMEITVKAVAAGYRVGEVPCTWKERVAGASRFRLFAWLPRYLKWYCFAVGARLRRSWA